MKYVNPRHVLVALILFCLLITVSFAQSTWWTINKELMCDRAEKILGRLNELGEEPIWIGTEVTESGSKYMYTLMVNQNTGDWSLLQYTKETVCILGAGGKSTMINQQYI